MAWAAGGKDPRKSKFLEGLLFVERLLVLPDDAFSASTSLPSRSGIRKGVFYLVSKARLGGERTTFPSSHLDIVISLEKASPILSGCF